MRRRKILRAALALSAVILCAAADGSWLSHVPEAERKRVNPYAHQEEGVAAGAKLFGDHCSKCHGADALGKGKKPGLRSERVQNATDGELFWLLKNGNLGRGMPSWSAVPEASRWQIIAYLKSLGIPGAPSPSGASHLSIPDAKSFLGYHVPSHAIPTKPNVALSSF